VFVGKLRCSDYLIQIETKREDKILVMLTEWVLGFTFVLEYFKPVILG
jgi:hypothetical protein